MIENINLFSLDTINIIVYVKSDLLKTIIKDTIKEKFDVKKNVSLVARSTKELKDIKQDTIVEPFGGGTWFIEVETEEIGFKELKNAIGSTYNSSLTVYWVKDYGQYKKLLDLEEVKRQGLYNQQLYFGRLEHNDIYFIQMYMLKDKTLYLEDKLMKYLIKNYTFNVEAVCDLFLEIKNGLKVNSTKDIIKAVGLGGNTIDSMTVKILTSSPKTDKGLDKSVSDVLVLLNDLSLTYDYVTIKRFMVSTLETILEIKQLQILGKFTSVTQDIPQGYNEYRIKRLRRFYRLILDEITIARTLSLINCLQDVDLFNEEIGLLRGVMNYLEGVKTSFELHPELKDELAKNWRR